MVEKSVNYARRFWNETERYHDLVEQYERDIEFTHPPYVTGMCWICGGCSWHNTSVKYYEHRGESI